MKQPRKYLKLLITISKCMRSNIAVSNFVFYWIWRASNVFGNYLNNKNGRHVNL